MDTEKAERVRAIVERFLLATKALDEIVKSLATDGGQLAVAWWEMV